MALSRCFTIEAPSGEALDKKKTFDVYSGILIGNFGIATPDDKIFIENVRIGSRNGIRMDAPNEESMKILRYILGEMPRTRPIHLAAMELSTKGVTITNLQGPETLGEALVYFRLNARNILKLGDQQSAMFMVEEAIRQKGKGKKEDVIQHVLVKVYPNQKFQLEVNGEYLSDINWDGKSGFQEHKLMRHIYHPATFSEK